jgi:hypothetical protein
MSGRVSPNQELDQLGDQFEAEVAAFQPVRKPKCFSKDAVAKHEQLKKEAANRKKTPGERGEEGFEARRAQGTVEAGAKDVTAWCRRYR